MRTGSHRARLSAALALCVALSACRGENDGDPAAFCAAAADQSAFDAVFAELDPTDVPKATEAFDAALAEERRLRDDAPAAVRSDIDVLIQFLEDLVDGLATEATTTTGAGIGGAEARPPIYDELRPRFDQVEAATDRIALYVSTNC